MGAPAEAERLANTVETTAASAPPANARRAAEAECAAAVTIQRGWAAFSRRARCAKRSGRWTPSASSRCANPASPPISRTSPRARAIAFSRWPRSLASGAPKARNTTAAPRGRRRAMASGSGVRAGSVKNSSDGRAVFAPFRAAARRPRNWAVLAKVQNPLEMAPSPPAYADVVARIARAMQAAGRSPGDVTLVAVSKLQPWEAVEPVLAAGQKVFGENRVQEAQGRWAERRGEIELRLIGPLQTNKAADAVAFFDVIETLDREKLARVLAEEIQKRGRGPRLYVQVNTGEEPQKAGVTPAEADAFIAACRATYGLTLEGLMCIPPAAEPAGPHFALLAGIAARNGLAKLSMGMSDDFEIAIAFGATSVRVGSAVFGARR